MKIIKQFGIVFLLCWVSLCIEQFLPFRFPASVIGMVLLLLLLLTGILKVGHIREKSDFLLSNMAFFFIPAGVSIMNYTRILKHTWPALLFICAVTMVLTFAATTYSIKLTLYLMKRFKKGEQ